MAAILNCAMTEALQWKNRVRIRFLVKNYADKNILQRNRFEILHKLQFQYYIRRSFWIFTNKTRMRL